MTTGRELVAATGLLVLLAGSAAGQGNNSVLAGAGLAAPTGVFNSYAGNGWDVTVGAEHRFGHHPTGVRVDFSYATNSDTSEVGFQETTHLITGMINLVYHFVGAHPALYFLAGGGVMARKFSSADPFDPPISDSRAALQVGEGFTFMIGRATFFVEARFISATGPDPLQLVPVIVGVRF